VWRLAVTTSTREWGMSALETGTADWVSPFEHRPIAAAGIQGPLTTAPKSVGLAIVAGCLI
jgi:hypothetical protein